MQPTQLRSPLDHAAAGYAPIVAFDQSLVSIGMPVYNGERFIEVALDSLLSQTHTNIEFVVSDNASTDNTAAIVRRFAHTDRRIRHVVNPTNVGILENFHAVAKAARGEFFMWAASDDIWERRFIERLLGVFARTPDLGLVYANHDFVNEAGQVFGRGQTQWFVEPDSPFRDLFSFSTKSGRVHNLCLHYMWRSPFPTYGLFRTEAVLRALPFEYLFHDCGWSDTVFLMKVYARERVGYIDEVLWHSRVKDRTTANARSAYLAPGATDVKGPPASVVDDVLRQKLAEVARNGGLSRGEQRLLRQLVPVMDLVRHARARVATIRSRRS